MIQSKAKKEMCVHLYFAKQILQVEEGVWHILENVKKPWWYKELYIISINNLWKAIQFVVTETQFGLLNQNWINDNSFLPPQNAFI